MDSEKKHKRSREKDSDHKSRKKHKHGDDSSSSKKSRKSRTTKVDIVDDNPGDDDDMWVEKNIDMDGERILTADIPTGQTLGITSTAVAGPSDPTLPHTTTFSETSLKRDDWMMEPSDTSGPAIIKPHTVLPSSGDPYAEDYGEPSSSRVVGGGGTERKRKTTDKPDPAQPRVARTELNPDIKSGKVLDHDAPPPTPKPATPGGPGSSWRMMRLKRVYETAEEEGLPIEKVALERFGSLEAFEEAKEERRLLDERSGKRNDTQSTPNNRGGGGGEQRFMFTDTPGSGSLSRNSSYRRPGANRDGGGASPSTPNQQPINKRLDSLRLPSQAASPLQQSHTPIPSVMTPTVVPKRGLSPTSLNRLQARVLRAKLMGAPDAADLEKEYQEASRNAAAGGGAQGGGGTRTKVEVLPTLDARGRMYDVGHGKDDGQALPGNRKKKEEKFETRDSKTGEIIRYNADDDTTTLGEMLRQERFGAGMADQKDLDAQFAQAIMGDGKFVNDLDYIDDNAEKLGRQKMRSDAMKRQFAVHDYKRTAKAMATCSFCYGEDDSPPKAPVIATGTRAYLSCTLNEELVEGHCLIAPIQHHLCMLEGDDDLWDEVRNFMKCVMRMFAEQDKGVIFYETVINPKWQNHTFIECVPLPWDQFEDIPQYFKESILSSESEWSQHKKLIDFSSRPGGFRRAMVPNLPYFMVQFDHKGEKGYGHVIEGSGEGAGATEEEGGMGEGEKGGGDFPKYFAGEIIGNVLELEPRLWRRPRTVEVRSKKARVDKFKLMYDKFDWTGMIGQ